MMTESYRYHPACLLFPRLGDAELREMAADIKERGLLRDVVLHEGQVLDGRSRCLACENRRARTMQETRP